MRLTKIKLAGFKTFVDPTTLSFPSNLTGVIGPNGFGKSNSIMPKVNVDKTKSDEEEDEEEDQYEEEKNNKEALDESKPLENGPKEENSESSDTNSKEEQE